MIYTATATIRGAFGFGAVAPAIIFSSIFLDPHYAVILALITGSYAQFQVIPFGLKNGDWRTARPMLITGFFAIILGLLVFKKLEPSGLTICLGIAMGLIVLLDRYHLLDRLSEKVNLRALPWAMGLSTASGLVAGIAGGGGMYLYSVYLKLVCPTPTRLRGTSILLGSTLLYWRFITAIIMGLVSLPMLIEALLLLPPSLLGAWAGIHFFRRADAKRFYGAFQILLLSGAAILLVKGLRQAL